MTPAISVRGVGKEFVLGERERYLTVRESVQNLFRGRRGSEGAAQAQDKRLWALKDVSFDVMPGEVVGVIGHNGAGKSTLLKILSRITEPTVGRIDIYGRVSSLLEVGTGFHPELTGRENIYLNGSILGMKKREIDAKFDEIVAFSGVERFLGTPVKRYSSGMHVRLAFAVAAHLEPEILLVDEVLAVGDAEFQRKCLGKMGDVARSGRTVLFVSHNMAAVEGLCSKGILLSGGRVAAVGSIGDVLSSYLDATASGSGEMLFERNDAGTLRSFRILREPGEPSAELPIGKDLVFEVNGHAARKYIDVTVNFRIDNSSGQRAAVCHSHYQHPSGIALDGDYSIACTLKNCRLMPGRYWVTVVIKCSEGTLDQHGPFAFDIVARDLYQTGKILPSRTGYYAPEVGWSVLTGAPVRVAKLRA